MPVELTIGVADDSGDESGFSVRFEDGFTLDNYEGAALNFGGLVQAVIDGSISSAFLRAEVQDLDTALTGNALGNDSDVEEVAAIRLGINSLDPITVNLPSYDTFALDQADTDNLDTADPNLATLITALEDGIAVTSGTTFVPTDEGEFANTGVISARGETRNSGRKR